MTNRPAGKSNDLGEERGELWGVLDRFRSTLFERGLTWVPFSGTGASYRDNRFHDGGQTDRTIPSNSFSKFFPRSPLRITALDARAVSRKGEEGKRVWCRKAANAAKGGGGGGREGTKNEAARDVTEEKRYGAERFPPSEKETEERRSESDALCRGVGTRRFGIMQVLVGRIIASYRRFSFQSDISSARPRVSRRFFLLFPFFSFASSPSDLLSDLFSSITRTRRTSEGPRYQGTRKERTRTGRTAVVHYSVSVGSASRVNVTLV